MGNANVAVNQWLSSKERFADLFNGTVFGGKQAVRPADLDQLKGESSVILLDKDKKSISSGRYRDIAMRWNAGADLAVLAVESQDKIHYAMPVRNMVYDSFSYAEQVRRIGRLHRNRQENQKISKEEFLSGFHKDDRILPVITLIFYYDVKEWNGAQDLYGMMQMPGNWKIPISSGLIYSRYSVC